MMILALLFIGVSLFLYVVLGGADFGAGIIELFTGKKGEKIISKAIAPIWEANHIWLIVVIVILFNAFPEVYSTITCIFIYLLCLHLSGSFSEEQLLLFAIMIPIMTGRIKFIPQYSGFLAS
jgi:cytochrome d ubiquinol oxidase subunit II